MTLSNNACHALDLSESPSFDHSSAFASCARISTDACSIRSKDHLRVRSCDILSASHAEFPDRPGSHGALHLPHRMTAQRKHQSLILSTYSAAASDRFSSRASAKFKYLFSKSKSTSPKSTGQSPNAPA